MKESIEKTIIWNPRYKIEFNILLNFINIINIVNVINVIITIRSSKSSRHNIAEVDVTESALTEPYKQKDRQTATHQRQKSQKTEWSTKCNFKGQWHKM